MRTLRPLRLLLAASLAIALSLPLVAGERAALRQALEMIQADQLRRHVDVLADDTFEGREAGSRGGRAAGGYLVREFQRNKVRPAGVDGGYFQPFGAGYRNLLGTIEGRDPELRHEVILIGAHYDHVGYGTQRNSYGPTGYIHNGADDNASGTAGLLELMKAFSSLPESPRRTILFALWDGEEKGLLGSKHWVAEPSVPLAHVKMAINVDMIGRFRDRVEVYGTRTGYGFRQLVSRANEEIDLPLDFVWKLESNSDHYTFYERQMPVLMLHTGLHDDYHRPSDDAHKINGDGMQQVARLLFNIVYELAERERVTRFRSAVRQESASAQAALEVTLPAPAPRLGAAWHTPDDEPGLVIRHVAASSPAAEAGLRVGDRLVEFNGQEITGPEQFRLEVLASPEEASLRVESSDADRSPRIVTVQLAGRPSRLGISWNEDDAEPGSVVLTRVVPGSAGDLAGLKPKDRLYEINGRRFRNGLEFKQLATTLPGPLEVLIERSGRLRRLPLPVPVVERELAVAE